MLFLPVLAVVERGWAQGRLSCLRQCHLPSCDTGRAVAGGCRRAQMEFCLHSCTCIVLTCTKCSCSMSGPRSLPSSAHPAVPPFSRAGTPVPPELHHSTFNKGRGRDNNYLLSTRVCLQQRLNWPCNGEKDSRAILCKRQTVFGSQYCIPVSQAIGVLCNRGCRILLSPGFQCNHLLTVLKVCPLWRKCSKLKKAAEVCVCTALLFLLCLLPQTPHRELLMEQGWETIPELQQFPTPEVAASITL